MGIAAPLEAQVAYRAFSTAPERHVPTDFRSELVSMSARRAFCAPYNIGIFMPLQPTRYPKTDGDCSR